jgi:hypothetical protein
MKLKRRVIVLLAVFALVAAMLTGCTDRDNPSGESPSRPTLQPEQEGDLPPPLPGGYPDDSDWVSPPYEPYQPEQPADDLEVGLPGDDPDDSDGELLPPDEPFAPPRDAPPRDVPPRDVPPRDPNARDRSPDRPPPPRNPDGTIG